MRGPLIDFSGTTPEHVVPGDHPSTPVRPALHDPGFFPHTLPYTMAWAGELTSREDKTGL